MLEGRTFCYNFRNFSGQSPSSQKNLTPANPPSSTWENTMTTDRNNLAALPPTDTVQVKDSTGKWRVRILNQRTKLNENAKGIFLEHYLETGRMAHSALAAGVTVGTVKYQLSVDKDFQEAFEMIEQLYADKVIEHMQNIIFKGEETHHYDKDGKLLKTTTRYNTALIQMEVKRRAAEYREKNEIDVKVTSGVMVAPSDINSIDEWEKKFQGPVIDHHAGEENPHLASLPPGHDPEVEEVLSKSTEDYYPGAKRE